MKHLVSIPKTAYSDTVDSPTYKLADVQKLVCPYVISVNCVM